MSSIVCGECGEKFLGRHGARYCSGTCRSAAHRRRKRGEQEGGRRDPVVLLARAPETCWEDDEPAQLRLVVPAADCDEVERLPSPELDDGGDVTLFGGEVVEVLDLVTRGPWLVRRGACGQTCACALQAWPADRVDPVPPPDPSGGWPLLLSEEEWGQLEVRLGRPVWEMPWDELVTVAGARWPL